MASRTSLSEYGSTLGRISRFTSVFFSTHARLLCYNFYATTGKYRQSKWNQEGAFPCRSIRMSMERSSKSSVYQVCQRCLQSDPHDISLISLKCKNEAVHGHSVAKVSVQFNFLTKELVEVSENPHGIRPKPPISLPSGKRYIMCNGVQCRGDSCTFPHSLEEKELWNNQLLYG